MDKGYTGPDSDTPEIFKLTPKKGLLTSVELNRNEELKKKRVVVECYFGRLKQLWKIFNYCYRLNHTYFDDDFEICVYLTNEHIQRTALHNEDAIYYKRWLLQKRSENKEKIEKRI